MERRADKKSGVQLIINALMTGKQLKTREIAEMVTELAGKKVKVQDVASMIARISNPERCNLGYFIKRVPKGNGYLYSMVEELLELSPEQIYGLSLKTGKDKYLPENAVKDYPDLEKYLEKGVAFPRRVRRKKPGRPPKSAAAKAVKMADAGEPVADIPPVIAGDKGGSDELQMLLRQIKNLAERNGLKIDINISVSI